MRQSWSLFFLAALLSACASPSPSPQPPRTSPEPPPVRAARAMTAVASMPKTIAEPKIRVGLLTDQATATFPRTEDGYYIVSDAGASTLRRGFTATAPLANATVRYAIQVASVSDERSAAALAGKIGTDMSLRIDRIFDTGGGAYRILAGDFATSEEAVPVKAQLTERGYGKDMLVVRRPSDQPFEKRIEIVDDEGDRQTINGESLMIMPITAETLTIDKKPYRTAARLFVNARGLLNVINEANLEDYLLGVVPAELGPRIYDEIEALKAQAVAARTYAVRNMGQFMREGYDICPGPACQAYSGFAAEDPLSNRAVRETAGLVITYEGKPIDALYTSTCGGETSDVSTMFPGRSEPYLKRARCVELDMLSIAGRTDSGLLTEQQVNARLFAALAGLPESARNWSATDVAAAVAGATRIAGMQATPAGQPASSRRGDVLRYLAEVFGLDEKGRRLTMPEDRSYYFPRSSDRQSEAHLAAAFLVKYGVYPAQFVDRVDLTQAMPREELLALMLAWVREQTALQEATAKIHKLEGRRVTLKSEGKVSSYDLPAGIPIYRRIGDRFQEYAQVPVMVGDRITVISNPQKRVVAAVVQANYDGASFDRTSSYANWTRSYRAEDLVPVINRRNPIRELVDIRPVSVDPSQRVRELEVTAEGGRKFMLAGLPVRWSLNVPDNLFAYDKTKDADGMDRYTFYGKGWGHGTGLCQIGSYGMAFRGWTFDQILKHYYTGVEIVPSAQLQK